MTLDDVLPAPDWATRNERHIDAPPEAALAAARAVTLAEMPLAAVLLGLRSLRLRRPPRIPFLVLVEKRVGLARVGDDVWAGLQQPWHLRRRRAPRRRLRRVRRARLGEDRLRPDRDAGRRRHAARDRDPHRRDQRGRPARVRPLLARSSGPGRDLVRASWLRAAERRVTVGSP